VRAITRLREPSFDGFLGDFATGFLPEKTLLAVASSASTRAAPNLSDFLPWFYIAASSLACGDTRRYYECLARALDEREDDQLTRSPEFLLAFWESRHDPQPTDTGWPRLARPSLSPPTTAPENRKPVTPTSATPKAANATYLPLTRNTHSGAGGVSLLSSEMVIFPYSLCPEPAPGVVDCSS